MARRDREAADRPAGDAASTRGFFVAALVACVVLSLLLWGPSGISVRPVPIDTAWRAAPVASRAAGDMAAAAARADVVALGRTEGYGCGACGDPEELRVIVRDAMTLAAIPDAVVFCLTARRAMEMTRGEPGRLDSCGGPFERVWEFGERHVADRDGVVSLRVQVPDVIHLCCVHEGRSAHRVVERQASLRAQPVTLDLRAHNALEVRVVGPDRRPLAGIPVGLLLEFRRGADGVRRHTEPWGSTDARGVVSRRGARDELDEILARLGIGDGDPSAFLVPLVAGAGRAEMVAIDFVRGSVEISMPKPVDAEVHLTGVGDRSLSWPDVTLQLRDPEGAIECTAVTRAGRVSIRALPNRRILWRARTLQREVGSGTCAVLDAPSIALSLAGVVEVRGSLATPRADARLEVGIDSPWRTHRLSPVEPGPSGRFSFPLLLGECDAVTLHYGGSSATVALPQPVDRVVELGPIRFPALVGPSAIVLLRQEDGTAVPEPQLLVEEPTAGGPGAVASALGEAGFRLAFADHRSEVSVIVGGRDRPLERHVVRANEEKTIVLRRSVGVTVRVDGCGDAVRWLAAAVTADGDGALVQPTTWSGPAPGRDGAPTDRFAFEGLSPGDYALEIWSCMPPCRLQASRVRIGAQALEQVVVPRLRSVTVDFGGSQGDLHVGLAVPADGGAWHVARVESPRQQLVVPAECTAIAYFGAGIVPGTVDVTMPSARVSPEVAAGPDPGALPTGSFARRLLVLTSRGERHGPRRDMTTWSEFARAHSGTWLPADYAGVDDGRAAVFEFHGQGWRQGR